MSFNVAENAILQGLNAIFFIASSTCLYWAGAVFYRQNEKKSLPRLPARSLQKNPRSSKLVRNRVE